MAWKPTPAQGDALGQLEAGCDPLPHGGWTVTTHDVRFWRQGRDGVVAICHRETPSGAQLFRVHRDGRVDKL